MSRKLGRFSWNLAFGLLVDRREYRYKLPGFIKHGSHFRRLNAAAFSEKFQPVLSLFDFPKTVANLGYEFRLGSSTRGFAVICTD